MSLDDGEMVEVKLTRGIGEKVVALNMPAIDLRKKSPRELLEDALKDRELSDEDKREISLIQQKINSGTSPNIEVLGSDGKRKLIPYQGTGLDKYVEKVDGKNTVGIEYGTLHEIGNRK